VFKAKAKKLKERLMWMLMNIFVGSLKRIKGGVAKNKNNICSNVLQKNKTYQQSISIDNRSSTP
jgi:hypothetical protein